MLLQFYHEHLEKQLGRAQFLMLLLLINIIQAEKEVRLETIARVFPIGITCEVRRRKIQRFLDLPSLTIRVHLTFANTSSGKLTIEISTAQRKDRGNTLDIPLRSR